MGRPIRRSLVSAEASRRTLACDAAHLDRGVEDAVLDARHQAGVPQMSIRIGGVHPRRLGTLTSQEPTRLIQRTIQIDSAQPMPKPSAATNQRKNARPFMPGRGYSLSLATLGARCRRPEARAGL